MKWKVFQSGCSFVSVFLLFPLFPGNSVDILNNLHSVSVSGSTMAKTLRATDINREEHPLRTMPSMGGNLSKL